jgi:superfamily I DNA/RNA helicase
LIVLRRHRPTPEQIALINRIRAGVTVIRGAAGSGKTSTALFSLRASAATTISQLTAQGAGPARILVLTYNNSLAGYIDAVASSDLAEYGESLDLKVSTFDQWAMRHTKGAPLDPGETNDTLSKIAAGFPRDRAFVVDEVQYLLGRFRPNDLNSYLTAPRTGRGTAPQMDRAMRERLLAEVVRPYIDFKNNAGLSDFNDIANAMIEAEITPYDVIVVDEAQDLSANQIRAVMAHVAAQGIVTFVTDTAQRIYPRGTTWAECGVNGQRTLSLNNNYRNTREIAALAAAIVHGLPLDPDGAPPDPERCTRSGVVPILLKSKFSDQADFAVARLAEIDLENETVAFLHLKGGGWFNTLRRKLTDAGYDYCELQGARDWPEGGSNIGLSTLHSAKGLEFDHVFIIGLAQEHAHYGDEENDDRRSALRRLVAMAVGRAKQTVVLGTKPGEELNLIDDIDPSLYNEIIL